MRALVVAHGPVPPLERVEPWLDAALVVAADGGADRVRAWGRTPDLLVGDLDSLAAGTLAWCREAGVEVVEHPETKEDTDGELAVEEALARGADHLLLAGGLGGRLDHTLANLMVLHRAARRGARVLAEDAAGTTWIVTADHPVDLDLAPGEEVTVLPLGGDAGGVALEGFRWELEGRTMPYGDPFGVSNVVTARPARVRVAAGVIAVMRPEEP